MLLGNNFKYLIILISFIFMLSAFADNKISSSPLINLEKLKPSFEETVTDNQNILSKKQIKIKKKTNNTQIKYNAVLIGLDKITAKSSQIFVKFNEVKKFGPLEIKILKCGKVENNNILDDVAYMQVKDKTMNNNDKVFVFNDWTFASSPSIRPFDHPVYDVWLVSCY